MKGSSNVKDSEKNRTTFFCLPAAAAAAAGVLRIGKSGPLPPLPLSHLPAFFVGRPPGLPFTY